MAMADRALDPIFIFDAIIIDKYTHHYRIIPGIGNSKFSISREEVDRICRSNTPGFIAESGRLSYVVAVQERYIVVFPGFLRNETGLMYQEGKPGMLFELKFLEYHFEFIAAKKEQLKDRLKLELAEYVHEFRALNETIRSSAERVLSGEFASADDLREIANNIFYASKMITLKMDFSKYMYSEAVPFTTKSVDLYRMATDTARLLDDVISEKDIFVQNGMRRREIICSPYLELCFYLILENAATYAPSTSQIYIKESRFNRSISGEFEKTWDYIISVHSHGVEIEKGVDIFSRGNRCKDAIRVNPKGEGYGLFIANRIAHEQLGGLLRWKQEATSTEYAHYFSTTFYICGSTRELTKPPRAA
jgi:signal transduction histidine kinase